MRAMRRWLAAGVLGIGSCVPRARGPEARAPAPPAAAPARVLQVREVPAPRLADPERLRKIEAALPAAREAAARIVAADQIVGLAVGVVVEGALVFSEGFGAREAGGGGSIDGRTVFRIGSLTKLLTTMTALRLAERGRLDLDAPASDYLPELARLAYPSGDARALTVRDIVTHRTGLPRDPDLPPLAASGGATRAELMAAIEGLGLVRPPGLIYEYSNLGFCLLGHLLAAVEGRPYHEVIRAEVLAPLGMGATVWEREEVPPGRLAMGHVVRAGRPALQPPTRHGALDAAGGLFSTVEDLARLVAVQLAAWPPRGGAEAPPLARQTLREGHVLQAMGGFRARTQPRELAPSGVDAGVAGVGLGWRVGHDCELGHVVSHSGAVDGYHANLRLLPQEGVGIVVLANSSWADTEAVAREIQRALGRGGGLQGRAPEAAPELARAAGQALELFEKWDDAAFAALSTAALRGAAGEIGGRLSWLRARLGACELGALKRASSAWSGVFVLACERGAAELTLALTTARAPKIASVSLAWIGGTPEPAVAEAAGAAAALLDRFDEASYRARFSIGVARTGFEGAAAALRFELGACRLGDAIEVSGPDAAVFAVVCERGPAKLALTLERGHAGLIGGLKVEPAGPAPACR